MLERESLLLAGSIHVKNCARNARTWKILSHYCAAHLYTRLCVISKQIKQIFLRTCSDLNEESWLPATMTQDFYGQLQYLYSASHMSRSPGWKRTTQSGCKNAHVAFGKDFWDLQVNISHL